MIQVIYIYIYIYSVIIVSLGPCISIVYLETCPALLAGFALFLRDVAPIRPLFALGPSGNHGMPVLRVQVRAIIPVALQRSG